MKKIIFVSALMCIAMAAMFVSCEKGGGNSNLCTCSDGQETHYVNPASEGARSCAELNAMAVSGVRCW